MKRPHSALTPAALVLVVTTFLAGCASAPEQPQSIIDPQANFGDYETFGWL